MKYLGFLMVAMLLIGVSCTKSEGVGGNATVTGVLKESVYNILGYQHTISAQGENVYITYGGTSTVVDDKIQSSYDGTFEFNYLRPGDYTVFAYSDSWTTLLGGDSVVLAEFTITEKKQEVDLGSITIVNRK